MIKDYIAGRRISYSHPMALLILLCAIYGVLIGIVQSAAGPVREDAATEDVASDAPIRIRIQRSAADTATTENAAPDATYETEAAADTGPYSNPAAETVQEADSYSAAATETVERTDPAPASSAEAVDTTLPDTGPSDNDPEKAEDNADTTSKSALARVMIYLFDKLSNSTIISAIFPVPFFAWIARRIFRRNGARKYNYAEMIFMGLYMACQRMLASILIQPFIIAFPDTDGFLSLLKNSVYIALAAWCFHGIFPVKWGKAVWKTLCMFIGGWVAMVVAITLLIVTVMLAVFVFAVTGLLSGNMLQVDTISEILKFI